MKTRKPSDTVQFKLNVKAELWAKLAEKAKWRGVTLNAEIVDRIKDASLVDVLSEGQFGLGDLAIFQRYVATIKAALAAVGEPVDRWLGFAKYVPFDEYGSELHGGRSDNPKVAEAFRRIAAAVKEERAEARRYIAEHGAPPEPGTYRKSAIGASNSDEILPDALHRHAAEVAKRRAPRKKGNPK